MTAFLHRQSDGSRARITSGPVADMHRPTTALDALMIGVALVFVAFPVWVAWGCGLPVGESRK